MSDRMETTNEKPVFKDYFQAVADNEAYFLGANGCVYELWDGDHKGWTKVRSKKRKSKQ